MAAAEVGDEQAQEDPTVNELQRRAAELLGHEARALPADGDDGEPDRAARPHAARAAADRRGADAHPDLRGRRAGGALGAAWRGRCRATPGGSRRSSCARRSRPRDWLQPASIVVARADAPQRRRTRLAARRAARRRSAPPASSGSPCTSTARGCSTPPSRAASPPPSTARLADTVQICFSKGLGCPMGAILAGSEERIEQAWRLKFLFGGALRQAGVVAAAMLYALDHNVERLAEDHARARSGSPQGLAAAGPAGRRRARPRRTSSASTSPRSALDAAEAQARIARAGRARRRPAPGRPARRHPPRRHRRRRRPGDRAHPAGARRPCSRLTAALARSSGRGRSRTACRASRPPSTAAARSSGARRSASPTQDGAEATPDTQYRIGSITKTFTAAAVMLLREDGQARRSTTRSSGTSRRRATAARRSAGCSPTAPGLQREPPGEVWETLAVPDAARSSSHASATPSCVLGPGEHWHYSNLAYALLGEVVARVAGTPFAGLRRRAPDRPARA